MSETGLIEIQLAEVLESFYIVACICVSIAATILIIRKIIKSS